MFNLIQCSMKRLIVLFGMLALSLTGCSKDETELLPKEVEFQLNYAFVESGSMSRAGNEVYNAF